MPKLKTKSACKKRFSITASGKVKYKNANKRHNMTKKSQRQIRNNRSSDTMQPCDAKHVKKKFMPYSA